MEFDSLSKAGLVTLAKNLIALLQSFSISSWKIPFTNFSARISEQNAHPFKILYSDMILVIRGFYKNKIYEVLKTAGKKLG